MGINQYKAEGQFHTLALPTYLLLREVSRLGWPIRRIGHCLCALPCRHQSEYVKWVRGIGKQMRKGVPPEFLESIESVVNPAVHSPLLSSFIAAQTNICFHPPMRRTRHVSVERLLRVAAAVAVIAYLLSLTGAQAHTQVLFSAYQGSATCQYADEPFPASLQSHCLAEEAATSMGKGGKSKGSWVPQWVNDLWNDKAQRDADAAELRQRDLIEQAIEKRMHTQKPTAVEQLMKAGKKLMYKPSDTDDDEKQILYAGKFLQKAMDKKSKKKKEKKKEKKKKKSSSSTTEDSSSSDSDSVSEKYAKLEKKQKKSTKNTNKKDQKEKKEKSENKKKKNAAATRAAGEVPILPVAKRLPPLSVELSDYDINQQIMEVFNVKDLAADHPSWMEEMLKAGRVTQPVLSQYCKNLGAANGLNKQQNFEFLQQYLKDL
eukprot:TRINITY_DN31007_c0_g1_i1.p1 TRINITY_DN31007_c0_g1~~TRINITY_DN31007_c0_g1_i1.p1  ORF type:complete len:447 (+),score=111.56 TRINITY_DN31007_c0_g1_i1:50-1342(+)